MKLPQVILKPRSNPKKGTAGSLAPAVIKPVDPDSLDWLVPEMLYHAEMIGEMVADNIGTKDTSSYTRGWNHSILYLMWKLGYTWDTIQEPFRHVDDHNQHMEEARKVVRAINNGTLVTYGLADAHPLSADELASEAGVKPAAVGYVIVDADGNTQEDPDDPTIAQWDTVEEARSVLKAFPGSLGSRLEIMQVLHLRMPR
jgi:hypothetical protein